MNDLLLAKTCMFLLEVSPDETSVASIRDMAQRVVSIIEAAAIAEGHSIPDAYEFAKHSPRAEVGN